MGAVSYPTLEHVAMEARPYPAHVLEGCETGLVLFAAAFLGHNDAIHFAEAGVKTTCVDADGKRLAKMAALYPESWKWAVDDAWKYAEDAGAIGERFDVVSADPFTGDAMQRCIESLDLWCSLARRAVVCGITGDLIGAATTPDGWSASFFPRSEDVHWLVLIRDRQPVAA